MAQSNRGDRNIGLDKTTAWGTETMPGVNDRVTVTDFTPPPGDVNMYENEGESGNENITTCIETLNTPEVNLPMTFKARYDSYSILRAFAGIYGQYSYTADTPEAGVNKHSILWDSLIADTTNLFHTISWDENTEIKYVASCLFSSITLSNDNGFQVAANMLGDRVQTYYAAAPQTVTSPSACEGDLLKMQGLTVRMNTQSGGALSGSDEVVVNSLTINPVRNYQVPAQESGTTYAGQPFEGDEPAEFLITMELRAKNATNAAWFAAYQAATTQKMDITFVGDTISGKTTAYTAFFQFPSVKFQTPPTYSFESPIPVSVQLKAIKAQTAPTGMTLTLANGYFYNTLTALTGYPTI